MKGVQSRVGIVSYGAYVPRFRIKAEEIARVWGHDPRMGESLNIQQKSVPAPDEDVATMSVEASRIALDRANIPARRIGALYVGSESHPYAVKPTGTIVAEALGAGPYVQMADYEFACKAGTAAIQSCMGLTASRLVDLGLAIGADTSQGAPGDALEYSASAGAAAIVVGREPTEFCAEINYTTSYTTDTPDFWRREGQKYPSHGERFTGTPAFFKHVAAAGERVFSEMGTTPADYDYAVFHQPNGKFPKMIGKKLGFKDEQVSLGLLAPRIGNTYSAAVILGLCNILDAAKPDERIFVSGYGSGAGSDAFDITVTKGIHKIRSATVPRVEDFIASEEFLDYATYAKFRGKIQVATGGSS
ncbi:MAG TPA: hydroxymethylglutaryl-CoA synthase [Candidatus Thermoplasmatota archaeon]|nr:hydroxymethylglutaryl-CoA synthase [Candidatus Thermoplasmatota archaeon]